jgi:hypothetical protein
MKKIQKFPNFKKENSLKKKHYYQSFAISQCEVGLGFGGV